MSDQIKRPLTFSHLKQFLFEDLVDIVYDWSIFKSCFLNINFIHPLNLLAEFVGIASAICKDSNFSHLYQLHHMLTHCQKIRPMTSDDDSMFLLMFYCLKYRAMFMRLIRKEENRAPRKIKSRHLPISWVWNLYWINFDWVVREAERLFISDVIVYFYASFENGRAY